MKNFIVINGKTMYLRECFDMEDAVTWAENHCDHSKEIIVREIETIDNTIMRLLK